MQYFTTSLVSNLGYRREGSNGVGVQDDEDSQRSSLMLDDKARSAFCSSSEADEENSDDDERSAPCERDATHTPEYASHRPSQPCMGVSASTLSQSSCKLCCFFFAFLFIQW